MPVHYAIGRCEIDPGSIVYTGNDVYREAAHKCIVEQRGEDEVAIFVCPAKGHQAVSEHFRWQLKEDKLIGGGSVYIDRDDVLVVGSYSGTYGFLPFSAAERFAAALFRECRQRDIPVKAARGDPEVKGTLHPFWSSQ
jgi:hypothetical protein